MVPITTAGYRNLKKQISNIRVELDKMPQQISEARSKGDLKENADYHAAKDRQGMLSAELSRLSDAISKSQIIDPHALPKDTITFGKKIAIQNLQTNQQEEYTIVGPHETSLSSSCISVTSPFSKSFLGKKESQEVIFTTVQGQKAYKILSIEYMLCV